MSEPRPELTLAHSADADDVFMWWPITGMVEPTPPHRRRSEPAIDTGRFRFRALPEDIQALNARAAGKGDLDVTAISFALYPSVAHRYALTAWGSSFGEGFGPKLVARPPATTPEALLASRPRIAVPGLQTTAMLALSALASPLAPPLAHPLAHGAALPFEPVPMRFDEVLPAVASGRAPPPDGGPLHAGLIIHEGQLMFRSLGLVEVADLGAWWLRAHGLPLPLGANAVRRDLDARFGPGSTDDVVRTLRRSIDHALAHRDRSLEYAATFSPLKARAELDRYVSMYVSELTVDLGERGRQSVHRLLSAGAELGLVPAATLPEFLRGERASENTAPNGSERLPGVPARSGGFAPARAGPP